MRTGDDMAEHGGERLSRRDEVPPGLTLAELVDVPMLQSMMDDFTRLTDIPMALIGLDGEVVIGAGWQDVCVQFHRVHPDTCAFCIESDTVLTADIPAGEMRLYQCKNGMWDAATPILAGGAHVGNLFTGQFFFDDEPIDVGFFRDQAGRYGFDEDRYIAAIERVPRLSREHVDTGLRFLTKLSSMISQLTYGNIERQRAGARLQEALAAQTDLTEGLAAERNVLQAIMENTDTHLAYLDPEFRFVAVNSTYAAGSGHSADELVGRNHFDLFPDEENQAIFEHVRDTGEPAVLRAKPFEFADQPWRGVTYWDWQLAPVEDQEGRLQGFAFSLQDVTNAVRDKAFSDAINGLNEVIHAGLDLDSVLARLLPALAAATGCETVAMSSRADDGRWRYRAVFGLPADVVGRAFGDDELPVTMQAMREERPLVLTAEEGEAGSLPGLAGVLGLRSMLVAPLSLGGRALGAVTYGFLSGPGAFDDTDVDFAGKISASLSLALRNSELYVTERETARLNAALTAIDHSIHGTLEFDEMLRRAVVEAAQALGCESSALDLREGDKWVVRHVYRFPDESVGRAFSDEEVPFAMLAAESRRPVVIDDAFTDPRVDSGIQRIYNVRSVMVTPVIVQDAVLAVLFFNYHDVAHAFTPQEVAFAERLSASLGLAIANARLYETEHSIADRLQGALLSLPAEVPGVEFAHSYHSASEAARVGGDFYDVFELDDGRVAVTIGDVAGKGLDAAVLTSLVKNTIRAHATEKGKTPRQILELANEVVFRSTATESFVTVFFAILDVSAGTLAYASAGHTTAAVIRSGRDITPLPPTGALLGAFAHVGYEQAEACLGQRDVLFLYTDGLTEARREGEQYGEERLFAFLRPLGGGAPGELVDGVVSDVVGFTGDRLRDDLAILAICRSGTAPE